MNKIKALREAACLTQIEFGKKIGVSKSAINNYECGYRKPKFSVAQQILKFAVEVGYPMTYSDVLSKQKEESAKI